MPALAALAKLMNALSRATSMNEVYAAALDTLQQGLGVARASILLFDERDVMSFVAWRGLSDDYRRAVNGHTPWRPDSTGVEPFGVTDVRTDLSLAGYLPVFEAEGIVALGFFPLLHRDRVIGKFMLYYAEPHELTSAEADLASTIASQIAFGVVRVRAELELQRERDRLDDIVASVPGVVWESIGLPPHQRVTFVSPQIEELLGYPVEDWYRVRDFWTKVHVDPEQVLTAEFGSPMIHHYRMRRADGRLIWTEVRTSVKEINGELVTRGVTSDITAEKEAEQRAAFLDQVSAVLAASLDYQTTLTKVADLTVRDAADWCTIDLEENGELRRLAVADRDAGRQEALAWLRTHEPSQHETGNTIRVFETGQPLLVRNTESMWAVLDEPSAERLRKLGCESFMIVPLLAGGRTLGALSLVSRDPKRLYDETDLALAVELGRRAGYAIDNARLYTQAQEANRAKDEFLATLSHELRTPMTATLGWAMMLRSHDLSSDNYRLAVETIERSTRAQAKLIDDILDVSRIVTGKMRLAIAPVSLRTVIEAAVDAILPSTVAKGIELNVHIENVTSAPLGDANRLQQVIWNLLSNAVKFTHAGGTVDIVLEQPSSRAVTITVRDNGPGIAPRLLPLIFERFRQGDSSSTRSHGGLGLGLAIVKSLVELHGGTVAASSEGEGKGATFAITLPVVASTNVVASQPSAQATPLALAGLSVLLVEDEDDTRHMLSAALENFGARVIAVGSVPAAFEVLRDATPHVVVSDIGMPDEDGYSLIQRLRTGEIEHVRQVPAIALTAFARTEDRERILASGFAYHLSKPIDPMLVVRTVREAAGR